MIETNKGATRKLVLLIAAGCLGLVSLLEYRASVFALLLLVMALASLSRLQHPKKETLRVFLIVGTVSSVIGMGRFVWAEAFQGIAEAHGRATSKRAVSLLREVLFAQDALRRYGMIDPDGDTIGSAGLLGELSGAHEARSGKKLATPPLAARYAPRVLTPVGPATSQDGYLIIICLPGPEETWASRPSEPVDDEKAERRWVAYAWPSSSDLGHQSAYFIDEHEAILETANQAEHDDDSKDNLRLVGAQSPPACDDAFSTSTKHHWKPWRDKKPRSHLPGDQAPNAAP